MANTLSVDAASHFFARTTFSRGSTSVSLINDEIYMTVKGYTVAKMNRHGEVAIRKPDHSEVPTRTVKERLYCIINSQKHYDLECSMSYKSIYIHNKQVRYRLLQLNEEWKTLSDIVDVTSGREPKKTLTETLKSSLGKD